MKQTIKNCKLNEDPKQFNQFPYVQNVALSTIHQQYLVSTGFCGFKCGNMYDLNKQHPSTETMTDNILLIFIIVVTVIDSLNVLFKTQDSLFHNTAHVSIEKKM